MPTVVIPRCFLDGEYTTDEVEVCFVRRAVGGLRSDLFRVFPELDRGYTTRDGEPVLDWFAIVRDEDPHALSDEDVVQPEDRVYLINQIGC
jgi:hypothetical protein